MQNFYYTSWEVGFTIGEMHDSVFRGTIVR